jgi:hypothetical protein
VSVTPLPFLKQPEKLEIFKISLPGLFIFLCIDSILKDLLGKKYLKDITLKV